MLSFRRGEREGRVRQIEMDVQFVMLVFLIYIALIQKALHDPVKYKHVTSDNMWFVIEDKGFLLFSLSIYKTLDDMT